MQNSCLRMTVLNLLSLTALSTTIRRVGLLSFSVCNLQGLHV